MASVHPETKSVVYVTKVSAVQSLMERFPQSEYTQSPLVNRESVMMKEEWKISLFLGKDKLINNKRCPRHLG